MISRKIKKWGLILPGIFTAMCLLTGCGASDRKVVTVQHDAYEKMDYQTIDVVRGDLEPSITLTLTADSYEILQYGTNNEELELEKVYVSVGDKVKKGQKLVTFKSDAIQKTIDENEEQYNSNVQLVEHYEKLMKIDSSLNYKEEIKQLRDDIAVESLYIGEAKKKLEDYQLVAKKDGTIIAMDDMIMNGLMNCGDSLISQACGSGKYKAQRPDGYNFKVGQTYEASADNLKFSLEVSEVTDKNIIFTPKTDMSTLSEAEDLSMTIKKKKLTDVVYIPKEAVSTKGGMEFVFTVDKDGYLDAVEVKTGDTVGENVVIKEGLSGGEKVTVIDKK